MIHQNSLPLYSFLIEHRPGSKAADRRKASWLFPRPSSSPQSSRPRRHKNRTPPFARRWQPSTPRAISALSGSVIAGDLIRIILAAQRGGLTQPVAMATTAVDANHAIRSSGRSRNLFAHGVRLLQAGSSLVARRGFPSGGCCGDIAGAPTAVASAAAAAATQAADQARPGPVTNESPGDLATWQGGCDRSDCERLVSSERG